MFDMQVQPILPSGPEMILWEIDVCIAIEKVHLLTLKRYLTVSPKTPSTMLYVDTGRYPLYANAVI